MSFLFLAFNTFVVIIINSYFYPRYLDRVENIKIKFMDCEYWKNNQIPKKLKSSQKWKIITTIGECNIREKEDFLYQSLNDNSVFFYHYEYRSLKHRRREVEDQASFYLRELMKKENAF